MSKQKVLSIRVEEKLCTKLAEQIRVEEKLCTKLAEQAKRSGYKTVSEYSRYLLQENGNPLIQQRKREQLARLICKLQTRMERNGIDDPELKEELKKIKEVIR